MLAGVNQIIMKDPWLLKEFEILAQVDQLSNELQNNAAKFFRYIDYNLDRYPALKAMLFYDASKQSLAILIGKEPRHIQRLAKLIYKNLGYLRQTLNVIVQPISVLALNRTI